MSVCEAACILKLATVYKITLTEIKMYPSFHLQSMIRLDLQQLYEMILVGNSACHGFTRSPGHTGGFYHLVCRHGVSSTLLKPKH